SGTGELVAAARYQGTAWRGGHAVHPSPDGTRVYTAGPGGRRDWVISSFAKPESPEPTPTPTETVTASPSPIPTVTPTPDPTPSGTDGDQDGVPDDSDNCPDEHNPGQQNTYGDARGDACEPQPPQSGGGGEPSPSPSDPPVGPARELGDVTATITAAQDITRYRAPLNLSGSISAPRDCAQPVSVELSRRIYGTDHFDPIATLEATADGSWTYTGRAHRNASYIATPRSTEGCEGVASSPVDVEVKARITVRVPGNCSGTIRGRVRPGAPQSRIVLQEQANRKWVKVAGLGLTTRSRFDFSPGSCGRFRLWWKGSDTNLESTRIIRVRR
ncbi:MAG: thrombospondin type 3 repeat-containing protein, partial [Actinomycetota bacterium]